MRAAMLLSAAPSLGGGTESSYAEPRYESDPRSRHELSKIFTSTRRCPSLPGAWARACTIETWPKNV